jgi:hypothetical protein
MNENRIIAAILTAALNSSRPINPTPGIAGRSEYQIIVNDYRRFLDMIQALHVEQNEPGMAR